MLQAYADEGRALALKQSEMEKMVRRARAEQRQTVDDLAAARRDKAALTERLEKAAETAKAKDAELAAAAASAAASAAAAAAAAGKVSTVEMERDRAREEATAKMAALEAAWAERKELRQAVADLTAARDAALQQVRDGRTNAFVDEAGRRQWQQREALLTATQQQLQDSLSRAMHEAGLREDALKAEVRDMRRRWEDALARGESLRAEAHESTAPLLRQVKALQEELRMRQETAQHTEGLLSERAAAADAAAIAAASARRVAEDRASASAVAAAAAAEEAASLKERLAVALAAAVATAEAQQTAAERLGALEGEVEGLREEKGRGLRAQRAAESRMRVRVTEAEERAADLQAQLEAERQEAQQKLTAVRAQVSKHRCLG
ncbi:unnamed protein product [Phaeothamnion confervicola]